MRAKPKRLTLDDGARIYLADCQSRGESPRTLEGKKSNLGAFLRWCDSQGITHCQDVEQATLELYRSYVSCYIDPRRRKKLDIATQRNRLTAVKIFLKRLHYHQLIQDNPVVYSYTPKPKLNSRRY